MNVATGAVKAWAVVWGATVAGAAVMTSGMAVIDTLSSAGP